MKGEGGVSVYSGRGGVAFQKRSEVLLGQKILILHTD